MERFGNLYSKIFSFENLYGAAKQAYKGKRFRNDAAEFQYALEKNLIKLQSELVNKSYQPGKYRSFYITDPKRRLISAAPYRDRVVHHALCRIIEPVFERTFIHDSYANRIGKGTHKALDRCTYFARRYRYVLKCDIEKYFPSIDHEILLGLIRRKIKCFDTLWLIERIIQNSNHQEEIIRYFEDDNLFTPFERRRGIPIGNLTSQFFANIYLNSFDHYIKETLRCDGYIRFADDFLIFSDDKPWLNMLKLPVKEYLWLLRLNPNPKKFVVLPSSKGISFLGWKVFPDHRRIKRSTGMRFHRRLKELQMDYAYGNVSLETLKQSIMSWIGHLKHGDTVGLRTKLLGSVSFVIIRNPNIHLPGRMARDC